MITYACKGRSSFGNCVPCSHRPVQQAQPHSHYPSAARLRAEEHLARISIPTPCRGSKKVALMQARVARHGPPLSRPRQHQAGATSIWRKHFFRQTILRASSTITRLTYTSRSSSFISSASSSASLPCVHPVASRCAQPVRHVRHLVRPSCPSIRLSRRSVRVCTPMQTGGRAGGRAGGLGGRAWRA